MTDDRDLLGDLETRLHEHGLLLLGGVVEGGKTRVVIGNAGSQIVSHVPGLPGGDPRTDPVNTWTRQVMAPIAQQFGATVCFPFDGPPWHPFVSWMLGTGQAFVSPLGLAIHPRYGLWFALRAALLFDGVLPLAQPAAVSPCETCRDRPCLSTCPVGAFTGTSYDAESCRDHLAGSAGQDCMSQGCRARRACPVGPEWRYAPAHAGFHMRAFAR
ncbi:MAG: hypothetical protein P1U37_03095 [Minwuia sp.]|nr:hypothetical protein [Minwuia sp.]